MQIEVRRTGEPCCAPVDYADADRAKAVSLAAVAKALGDPVRLQLVDVLRRHGGEVCVHELLPLFDVTQQTLSHHLKKLRDAGIVEGDKDGYWVYYRVVPGVLDDFAAWLR